MTIHLHVKIDDLLKSYDNTPDEKNCKHNMTKSLSIITNDGVYWVCRKCDAKLKFISTAKFAKKYVSFMQQEKLSD